MRLGYGFPGRGSCRTVGKSHEVGDAGVTGCRSAASSGAQFRARRRAGPVRVGDPQGVGSAADREVSSGPPPAGIRTVGGMSPPAAGANRTAATTEGAPHVPPAHHPGHPRARNRPGRDRRRRGVERPGDPRPGRRRRRARPRPDGRRGRHHRGHRRAGVTADPATPRAAARGWWNRLSDEQRGCLQDAAITRPVGPLDDAERAALRAKVEAAAQKCQVTLPFAKARAFWDDLTDEQRTCLKDAAVTRPWGPMSKEQRQQVRGRPQGGGPEVRSHRADQGRREPDERHLTHPRSSRK